MSSKTKIVVLHMKEVVYTLVFLFLAIVLGIVLFFMFGPGHSSKSPGTEKERYHPGVYRSSITLNDNTFDVEVTVDSSKITSIDLVNLSETTSAMFPLMEPVLESISARFIHPSLWKKSPGRRTANTLPWFFSMQLKMH